MLNRMRIVMLVACSVWLLAGRGLAQTETTPTATSFGKYAVVRLTSDLSGLSAAQRAMLPHLFAAARHMDAIFWIEAYGERDELLARIDDPNVREFARINYGPWDRLGNNQPFVPGIGPKPPGANFYPSDMTSDEFTRHLQQRPEDAEAFKSLYTLIRRDENGALIAVPYRQAFARHVTAAATHLRQAAALAEHEGFKAYLLARADALLTDDYRPSDLIWMEMKDNPLDVVIGPIETYEDQLFGYKAAHEAFILIKDRQWSERLARYTRFLPDLQRQLPVPDAYKREEPGLNSDLNAYDVIYYAGDCNAGAKTIAINLPNDEQVQLQKGTRRLQLKNAMRAKFDRILVPIADLLIAEEQRPHVTFDAFFANTMFHEVAHGLGIKYTIEGQSTVRDALRELSSSLEEGKADILGLYMITQLHEQGELTGESLMDYYVTFMAGIFRSVRFGASSAHGRANMLRFNFFAQHEAFRRGADGRYRIDASKMKEAMEALSREILILQGDGDYAKARRFVEQMGSVGPELQADLERVNQAGIPVDIVFQQGPEMLGLPPQEPADSQ